MQSLIELLRGFFRGVRPWVVIAPWEQGLHVRLGKHVRLLAAGFHLRIPIIDVVHVQSVRLRLASISKQTLTTTDGKTVTLRGAIGYCIESIETLYRELHHAEDTVQCRAQAIIAEYVAAHTAAECQPRLLEAALSANLHFAKWGLGCTQVFITDFAIVRTYRLIGDQAYGGYGSSLSTEQPAHP